MKKNLLKLVLSTSILFSLSSKGQTIAKGMSGMYPESVDFKNSPYPFKSGAVIIADENGKLSTNTSAKLKNADKDDLGMEHYRYQQSYQGISVEHATYILHVKNNAVISENGLKIFHHN